MLCLLRRTTRDKEIPPGALIGLIQQEFSSTPSLPLQRGNCDIAAMIRIFSANVRKRRTFSNGCGKRIIAGGSEAVLAAPIRRQTQSDGRICFCGRIAQAGETRPRYLRVVTLEDGETVHNAFLDRNFRAERP